MAPKVRFNVDVTEADIERAHRNDSYTCVVAQAIARTIPDATRVDVDTQSIRFTVNGERRIYLTPYAVQGYVVAFDAGEEIQPFSFHLRDPKRVARTVRTAEGTAALTASTRARRAASKRTRAAHGESSSRVSPSADDVEDVDPREAAKAAYAEASKAATGPLSSSDRGGRKSPPRVFKRKARSYGHRLLRINQD